MFFGSRLAALPAEHASHVARYVAHFQSASDAGMWIVYRDEGASLYQMMFRLLPGPVPLMVPSAARRTLHRRPALLRTLLQVDGPQCRLMSSLRAAFPPNPHPDPIPNLRCRAKANPNPTPTLLAPISSATRAVS